MVCAIAALAGGAVFAALAAIFYPLTGSAMSIAITAAVGACIFGGLGLLIAYTMWTLVPPIVMLENTGVLDALRRSRKLVKRSFVTAASAVFIVALIPAIFAGSLSFIVNTSGKAFDSTPKADVETIQKQDDGGESVTPATDEPEAKKPGVKFSFGKPPSVQLGPDKAGMDMQTRVKSAVLESLIQLLWLPMQILVFSFSAIIVALLYLKTRLAGGESMNDLIERFEDDERPRKKWQERVRQRPIQSGRIPSKP